MDEIKFDSNNYRKHSDKNKDLIKKSLEKCGTGRSIVIDSQGEIIAGNGVYEQAKALNIPVQIVKSDGSKLIVVQRTDLKTKDKKRKEMAAFDNSTSDGVVWDLANLSADFDLNQLADFGIENIQEDVELAQEELMNNDLQEMQTNKMIALSRMPISKYLVISFDDDHTKEDFIEFVAKKFNEKANVDVKTQYCDYYFNKKDMLNDAE